LGPFAVLSTSSSEKQTVERHLRGNSPSRVVVTAVISRVTEHGTAALPPAGLLTPVVLPQFTIPTGDSTKLHLGISPASAVRDMS